MTAPSPVVLSPAMTKADQPLRMLGSYWYWDHIDFALLHDTPIPFSGIDFFADSGAFTAFKNNAEIDVGAYADWLHRWSHRFTAYANLDVKGDVALTAKNQRELERRGLNPVPVFHGGEPFAVLKELVEEYDYIALGGIAGGAGQRNKGLAMRWLNRCFDIAGDKARFHGFGMTTYDTMRRFPWRSCDSTSWMSGALYGGVNVFDPFAGKYVPLSRGDHKGWYAIAPLIRRFYGFDPAQFAHKTKYHYTYLFALGFLSARTAERWIARTHKRPFSLYLAASSPWEFERALVGMGLVEGPDKQRGCVFGENSRRRQKAKRA